MTKTPTITSDKQAEEVRAKLADAETALTSITERAAAVAAEIDGLVLAGAISGKPDATAIARLEAQRDELNREAAHTPAVVRGLRAMLDEWDAGEIVRRYRALIPELKTAHAAGKQLEGEYMAAIEAAVAIGRKLSKARRDQNAILNQMRPIEDQFAESDRSRETFFGAARDAVLEPFPINDRWLGETDRTSLQPIDLARVAPHWSHWLEAHADKQTGPDTSAA